MIETRRLLLREMGQSDYAALSRMLQDEDVMYAYNGAFSDEETQAWLDRQMLLSTRRRRFMTILLTIAAS